MKKAIIFDFDGVIHNTLQLCYDINKQMNSKITLEEYKPFLEGNLYKRMAMTPENHKKFFELQNNAFKNLKTEENVKSGLLKLKKNYDLFIVTSNLEITLKEYFENNHLHTIFKEVLGYETHTSKEKKFEILLAKHNLHHDNCIFVTDTLRDILEANKMGIETIAVDFGFHERARLERGNPLKIISKFEDILPSVEEIFKKRGKTAQSQHLFKS